ncbi:MAG: EAL domain-containing protein [Clostridia bacterium]|nr:EAL domain-containing protein [Clostridia bacterium]
MREKRIERAIKRQQKKQDDTRSLRTLVLILIILISGALIAGSLLMLLTYSQTIEQEASYVGMRYSGETANHLKVAVDEYEDRAENLVRQSVRGIINPEEVTSADFQEKADAMAQAIRAINATSRESFSSELRRLTEAEGTCRGSRIFKDGKEYKASYVEFETNMESQAVLALAQRGAQGCAGVVSDQEYNVSLMAYVYSIGSPYADSVVLFFTVGDVNSGEEYAANLRRLVAADDESRFARYFKDGKEYSQSGTEYDTSLEDKGVLTLVEQRVRSCAGVVTDRERSVSVVAFVVPLDACPYADAVVMFYAVGDVISFPEPLSPEITDSSRVTAVTSHEGEVLQILYQDENDGMGLNLHNNIYESLKPQINDKTTIDQIKNNISVGTSDVYAVQVSYVNHVISVSTLRENDSAAFAIIGVYRSDALHGTGYSTVRAILGVLIIFSVLLLIMVISGIITRRRAARRLRTIVETNEKLGVATRIKFERVVDEILSRNRVTTFAVCAVDMRHFNYISDQLGEENITEILLYLKMLFSRMVGMDETYAYAGNGRWLLLLHFREQKQVEDRLKATVALAASYNAKLPSGYHLNLYGGLYLTENKLVTEPGKMVDLAVSAEDALNFPYDFGTFRIYNEKIHESKALEDYIEVHMESALESHQFQVFYQPKFNLGKALPDGCEALVRWYNPDTDDYMQPGVFIPLFEANRFIVKLDHNVYEQVCEYIEEAVIRGQTLYPVSVNVSRITAAEPGFCEYYASVKKKHNIANGFLTIEFTESFAYEDYDRLRSIVNELHKNGFKCSIDDFGSGFSSYSILKELPMDEIKLDRFFIDRGIDETRDLKILSSVINIGRDLGMKVTQEGVETEEQLQLLKKMGCHVIQGFHYAKPMRLSDYIEFITRKSRSDLFTRR